MSLSAKVHCVGEILLGKCKVVGAMMVMGSVGWVCYVSRKSWVKAVFSWMCILSVGKSGY